MLLGLATPGTARARQSETGEIFGRVTNQQGASLAGAAVHVQPLGGARRQAAQTDEDGLYRISSLAGGIYLVDFSLQGFQTRTHAGVVVLAGGRLELNTWLISQQATQASGSAGGQTATASSGQATANATRPGEVLVRLETPLGAIDLAIDTKRAPITAANFLKYVDGGFYDGGRFHRATRPDNYKPAPPDRPAMEIIQAGINPDRRADQFPPIPLERTSVTGLKHVRGVVSMARGNEADTARSDFFILLDDQPSLDFGGRRFEDAQGAAAFGRVVAGLEVVRTIQQQPVEGQNLTPPVPIVKAFRVK